MNPVAQNAIENVVLQTLKATEERLDQEISELQKLKDDDLEALREKRKKELMKMAEEKRKWASEGHGSYTELAEEKQFFQCAQKSENLVVHFYQKGSRNCDVLDQHLAKIANRHMETKIVKLDVEKAPFLTQRLNVWMIPTLQLVKKQQSVHQICGFDPLGGTDKFTTEYLEAYLSQFGVLKYDGEIPECPTAEVDHVVKINKPSRSELGCTAYGEDEDDFSD